MDDKVKSPKELLDIAVSFQRSQVLFTFVELEIAQILNGQEMNAGDLADSLDMDPMAMERFLNASVLLGLLEKERGTYRNSELSERFLVRGKRFYLGGQIKRYRERSYPQWENLTGHLESWKYGENADETPVDEDQNAEAMAEQHNLALMHGHALAGVFDFSKYKKLLDVGGGTGAMSIALCEEYPELSAFVYDLPENVQKAESFISESAAKNRITTIAGDITENYLPEDFDIALLANLLAVFDAETNIKLFERIYNKLPEGGAILISGWILDEDSMSPEISVLFCLEDICWKSPDVERNFRVYKNWLRSAGFKDISVRTYFEPTRMILGIK